MHRTDFMAPWIPSKYLLAPCETFMEEKRARSISGLEQKKEQSSWEIHFFGSETNIEGTDWRLRGWRAPPDSRSFHSWKYSWPTIQQIHSSIHGNSHHLPGNKYIIPFIIKIFIFFCEKFPSSGAIEALKFKVVWGRWHTLMNYTIQIKYY